MNFSSGALDAARGLRKEPFMATVFNRKFAVITGASSGIGYALAEQCVQNGFDVLITAESDAIRQAAERLETSGALVYDAREDLSTPEGVERIYQRIVDTGRAVDALMLNAGVGLGGAFLDTSLESELRMIALNCGHTVHLAKRVISDMVANHAGRVLITGSMVSTAPSPFQAVYGATKAFLFSFGEAIREELAASGVTVTVLQPGATETEFFERAGMQDTGVGSSEKDSAWQVAKAGFEAMLAGRASVLAGSFKSKLQGALHEVLPEPLKARQIAKQSKPGSGKG
jgi:uncharacterized protein